MRKNYIIVGDNNFWYATLFRTTEKGANKELNRIRKQIEEGVGSEFDEPSEASTLYLYEAKEITRAEITDNGTCYNADCDNEVEERGMHYCIDHQ